ncbi:MAG: PepSY domain-containing protein [Mariniblastus sp.]|nr:PepSY domain-containing protein [Mariniblastus sp.]
MKVRNWRKVHRYLGLIIGVQLFLWTVSGMVFSWNSIRAVRGENMIRTESPVDLSRFQLDDLNQVFSTLSGPGATAPEPVAVNLRSMLGRPVYEIACHQSGGNTFLLVDAQNGTRLSPISPEQAGQIAQADFAEPVEVRSVELIEVVGSHSEYRGKELPAYRVALDHPTGTVIYVSADRGVVTTRRNNRWRVFDFFWMLHTMDYQGRDGFNHWLLRIVSAFGLLTVLTGYVLWLRTSPFWQRKRQKRQPPVE